MKNANTTRPGFWLRAIEYRKHELAREQRHAFRETLADKARADISDEDYATTMATLEKMARNLGWSDDQEIPRHGHGFGPFGRGGRGHGFGRGPFRADLPHERPEA
ncbi:MAG TPA: hypothetical protein PK282_01075 [Rhodoglobus sp.]|nr:hypothetical protein [Rhodoglobus sp.]HPG76393.1 hypothetical protein [Rhodoglobus sp.]HPM50802.1 hypothetical protein [Rhodoglobus sp.]